MPTSRRARRGWRPVCAGPVWRTAAAVALMLPTGADYFFGFFGILAAGGIPVPIYPPARPEQIEDHLRRHAGSSPTPGPSS